MPQEKLRVRVILFDLDGTLINSVDAYHNVVLTTFQQLGLPPVEKERVLEVMRFLKNPWESLVPEGRPDRQELIDKCKSMDKEIFYEVFSKEITLIDGSVQVVKELKNAGFVVGIVTSSWGTVGVDYLDRHGLKSCLDIIITSRDVPAKKPAPDSLVECLFRLGSSPKEAVYVGDSPVDIQAARAAGTWVVGVLTGTSDYDTLRKEGPDRIINNVGELPGIVELLEDRE